MSSVLLLQLPYGIATSLHKCLEPEEENQHQSTKNKVQLLWRVNPPPLLGLAVLTAVTSSECSYHSDDGTSLPFSIHHSLRGASTISSFPPLLCSQNH